MGAKEGKHLGQWDDKTLGRRIAGERFGARGREATHERLDGARVRFGDVGGWVGERMGDWCEHRRKRGGEQMRGADERALAW